MNENERAPMTEAMYYVLLAIHKPLHGYAIMNAIREASGGRVNMGPGTLYGILKRMEKDKLIVLEDSDGRRKNYQITSSGRIAFKQEYMRLTKMVEDGDVLFRGEGSNEK
ncbi:PadR family transcriptional regulator [Cytobacillus sp. IB215665]|uniref:PadR family transcriptional regulator n=1 Tax=Cytobacillus sp. IB215665 TaxID=3097357 RepID=UPI002A12F29D|nr:PadR family transcriptional regulator [Cytobacillus sp. IB215665]MDX8366015.1 PadR family transcriptional regulator [Cytobacillus sp. IB215665]